METFSERAAAGDTATALNRLAYAKASSSTKGRLISEAITVRVLPDGAPITARGRDAQTLRLLLSTGAMGFNSGEASPLGWARRTSHYIFKLRRAGIPIATTWETTADGARVARYTLAARLEVVTEGGDE
jgi:hypothetical protein